MTSNTASPATMVMRTRAAVTGSCCAGEVGSSVSEASAAPLARTTSRATIHH